MKAIEMRENFGKFNGVYLQKYLYLRCLLSVTTELSVSHEPFSLFHRGVLI